MAYDSTQPSSWIALGSASMWALSIYLNQETSQPNQGRSEVQVTKKCLLESIITYYETLILRWSSISCLDGLKSFKRCGAVKDSDDQAIFFGEPQILPWLLNLSFILQKHQLDIPFFNFEAFFSRSFAHITAKTLYLMWICMTVDSAVFSLITNHSPPHILAWQLLKIEPLS